MGIAMSMVRDKERVGRHVPQRRVRVYGPKEGPFNKKEIRSVVIVVVICAF